MFPKKPREVPPFGSTVAWKGEEEFGMVLALNAKIRGYSGENIGIRGSRSTLPSRGGGHRTQVISMLG